MFAFLKPIRNYAIPNVDLANDFSNGSNELVPVIFSHGFGVTFKDYQLAGMEMASNGFLVLMMNHLDGTCRYTDLKDGSTKIYDDTIPNPFPAMLPWLNPALKATVPVEEVR